MSRIWHIPVAQLGMAAAIGLAAGSALARSPHELLADAATPGAALHLQALAALPTLKSALDNTLTDYSSARFRDVHARLVRSIYDDDEGHSDQVPWTHRGGLVLVICGEVNSKNRMGGYVGWTDFAFEPAQTDIVPMYNLETPRTLIHINLARKDRLMLADGEGIQQEWANTLCTSADDGELTDPTNLADLVKSRNNSE